MGVVGESTHPHGRFVEVVEPFHAHAQAALHDLPFIDQTLEEARKRAVPSQALTESLNPLLGLVHAHVHGEFVGADRDHVAWALAAAMYVVSPWDLTPDYLPHGLRDDEQVTAAVVEMISETVYEYEGWARAAAKRARARSTT